MHSLFEWYDISKNIPNTDPLDILKGNRLEVNTLYRPLNKYHLIKSVLLCIQNSGHDWPNTQSILVGILQHILDLEEVDFKSAIDFANVHISPLSCLCEFIFFVYANSNKHYACCIVVADLYSACPFLHW